MEHNIYFYSANFQTALWFYVNANISSTSHIQNSIYWLGSQAHTLLNKHFCNIKVKWYDSIYIFNINTDLQNCQSYSCWFGLGHYLVHYLIVFGVRLYVILAPKRGNIIFFGCINNFYVQSASYLPFLQSAMI